MKVIRMVLAASVVPVILALLLLLTGCHLDIHKWRGPPLTGEKAEFFARCVSVSEGSACTIGRAAIRCAQHAGLLNVRDE